MKRIALIDYGMCNLDSVSRAVERCGGEPVITSEAATIKNADGIILPGVGAFADAMAELEAQDLVELIRKQVLSRNIPFLGICLGMQLMATKGHEGGVTDGLDLIPGEIVRLVPDSPQTRIPHVGWNEVIKTKTTLLFKDIPDRADFYFVHSYHFKCDNEYIITTTPYCGGFTSTVGRENCFGLQFHPEKSLKTGLMLLRNFIDIC